ncbi:Uu.00g066230.m01.CDS01 [Anthostomella pinea]|uniref:Uu.00g066230.m01.CDS01 n=1 Tax=Anthostomella pinea TaxID=933095 RepID=A0AAI8YN86_9PEZI|nr:Uu.00g066230.m01.CDS01 [Anthostomella pinea]
MDFSIQGLVQQHSSQMDYAFRNLVDAILRYSELKISLIRISNVTEDSFHVSLEARVTKTGPASATLTPMTIDLCAGSSHAATCFGRVTLPQITTQPNGAPIVVSNQLVRITDAAALQAFIRPVIGSNMATLILRNGNTTVRALGVGPRAICYEKDITFAGMGGPDVCVQSASTPALVPSSASQAALGGLSASATTNSLTNPTPTQGSLPWCGTTASLLTGSTPSANAICITIHVTNPSPVEISFGTCGFEIQSERGDVFAELKGRLDIRRNHFEATFQGTVVDRRAVAPIPVQGNGRRGGEKARNNGVAKLVGKRCVGAGWCDETVKGINVPIGDMWKVFKALGMTGGEVEVGTEEEDNKAEKSAPERFGRWRSKLFKR